MYKFKRFLSNLVETLTNVLPGFTIGFFVGFALFSQLPLTWYNTILVLGLCFMTSLGFSALVDIVKTSRRSDHEFTIHD